MGGETSRHAFNSYNNLIRNLRLPTIDASIAAKSTTVYITSGNRLPGDLVWKLKMMKGQVQGRWEPHEMPGALRGTFTIESYELRSSNLLLPPDHLQMKSILTGRSRAVKSGCKRTTIGEVSSEAGLASRFYWKDNLDIHEATTASVRKLHHLDPPPTHSSIIRWSNRSNWTPPLPKLWHRIWLSWRSEKENLFLWQIIYQTPATNAWRHPGTPRNAQETWCSRCELQAYEDVQHCIWWCPRSWAIWDWAASLMQHSTPNQHRGLRIEIQQALLAEPLTAHKDTPRIWWELIKGACCWLIWKSRCTLEMEETDTSERAVIGKIWHRLRLFMFIE